MKKILNILIVIAFASVKAQTISEPTLLVEYTFFDNFRHNEHTSILIMNKNESVFKTNLSESSKDKTELKGNDMFIGGKRIDTYYYTNKQNKQIISYESSKGKPMAISEVIPKLDWTLSHTETKKINNYICNKATLDFRGRTYTAWYTKEIPSFFGPWKFSGLPGLILEVKDNTNTYHWIASKIKTKNIPNLTIPYKDAEKVTLIEFIELRAENLEQLRARVRSKLPKGTQFSTPKNSRQGLEKTFEWEDEE